MSDVFPPLESQGCTLRNLFYPSVFFFLPSRFALSVLSIFFFNYFVLLLIFLR